MKNKYPPLIGLCKDCIYKCGRVEDPSFLGVSECKWAEKKKINKYIQERIKEYGK